MNVLALDIGGANIKAAWGAVDRAGRVSSVAATSHAFALWKEPGALAARLEQAAAGALRWDALAVTMTGELCDCFESRRQGVGHIVDAVAAFAGARPVRIWTTAGRWASPGEARRDWLQCASANWHALASWAAKLHPMGRSLLIDTGSTTTDLTPLCDGRPAPRGDTDLSRCTFGELLYTGVQRTPLMSLSPIELDGGEQDTWPRHLFAEHFATTADVYVLTGDLPEEPGCTDTADGRPLTKAQAAERVLRMIGADVETSIATTRRSDEKGRERAMAMAINVAEACAAVQRQRVADAIRQVISGVRDASASEPFASMDRVIIAGSGGFIAEKAAVALPNVPVVRLAERIGDEASTAACAVALLHLWGGPGTAVPGL